MQGPPQNLPPDPGALAMQSAGELGELSTIATAQLLGGISGMLVSEGLSRVLRDIMGAGRPKSPPVQSDQPAEAESAPQPGGDTEALTGLSAKAMKEMVAQGVAGRIVALNTLNTYLSLAASEQLRRMGAQLAGSDAAAGQPQPPAQPQLAWPQPSPLPWQQPAPAGPYWFGPPYSAWAGPSPSPGGRQTPPPYPYRYPGCR